MNLKKIIGLVFISLAFFSNASANSSDALVVFAAASTTNIMQEIAVDFQEKSGARVLVSFAASSALARQIANGAPADIFISANLKWMEYLKEKRLIVESSQFVLVGNRLALIAHKDNPFRLKIEPGAAVPDSLRDKYIAIANPDHAPVGMYAKASLKSLAWWETVKKNIAATKDVRAALMLVERKETEFGIVYLTDAKISDKTNIVGIFPASTHPPIVYVCAQTTAGNGKQSEEFIRYLKSPHAKRIFQKYGFQTELK